MRPGLSWRPIGASGVSWKYNIASDDRRGRRNSRAAVAVVRARGEENAITNAESIRHPSTGATANEREPSDLVYDLHVHSVASDGLYSVMQLCDLARRSGLAGFALTDHDTAPDSRACGRLGDGFGIDVMIGIELSTEFEGRGLHLLGYEFDTDHAEIRSTFHALRESRRNRWVRMVEALSSRGVRLDEGRTAALANSSAPGRLHLARELVREGYAGSTRAAFSRYMNDLGDAATFERLPFAEAVALLHRSGGVAVLAHPPAGMTEPQWRRLVDCGLDGVEARFPAASNRHQRFLREIAEEHDLLTTAGSDFHGDSSANFLGRCTVDRIERERLSTVARGPTETGAVPSDGSTRPSAGQTR